MGLLLYFLLVSTLPFIANAFVCSSGAPRNEVEVLQVHIVPHTHDDVGWLKTVDEYYYGANNSIQIAGVQYILDSVIPALVENPERRFIYVEIAFFKRWWDEQTPALQEKVKDLVKNGQLEFINGGWCMNDEASTHYNAIIDQMTHGLRFIDENFGPAARPRVAWHIDPFGHSAEQASLFAQMSFEGFFFARIHYADMKKRLDEKRMELMWRGSQSLGKASEIITGILYNGYGPPGGFSFDIYSGDPPIQDDPRLFDFNVNERVELFVNKSCEQALHYNSGHIMLTMGNDFNYQNANTWFKNLDKLIKYTNKDGRVNVFYSTPSKYLDAIKNIRLEVKTDDFFPYADCPHCYWTGYFTSRPSLKGYVRKTNNLLQVCKQLEVLGNIKTSTPSSLTLRSAMGVAQHHDAVSGTEKQHVAFDYAKRLAIGVAECQMVIYSALNELSSRVYSDADVKFTFCNNLNVSACPATEAAKSFSVAIYNPIARFVDAIIRVPVQSKSAVVYGPDGKPVTADVFPVSNATAIVRGNLGNAPFELVFRVKLGPLGFVTYQVNITSGTKNPAHKDSLKKPKNPKEPNGDYIIENENLRLTFSGDTGRVVEMENLDTSIKLSVDQQFFWYNASVGNNESGQASGAYIFRPNSSKAFTVSDKNHAKVTVFKGAGVQEVRQVFSPWLSQVVRLYKSEPYAEFEYTVGPIKNAPLPTLGKEVISRFDTSLQTKGLFYTDANGREMQKRTRNFRPTWQYNGTEPVAGNYYPVNSRAYIRDEDAGVQLTVLTDRSLGGSSLRDGSLEIMVHRRLLLDDRRGVSEALDEPGRDGRGLIVRGRFLVLLETAKASAALHRVLGEQEMLRPSLAFAAGSVGTSYQALTRPLPVNVHLLTLEKFDKVVLLRLEHQFAVNEDAELSKPVTVQLGGLFKDFKIVSFTELNLAANQVKSSTEMENEVDWMAARRENSISKRFNEDHNVVLKAMEIRTFKLDVEWN